MFRLHSPRGPAARAFMLMTVMCTALVLNMLGVFAFPALVPLFLDLWDLSNSQAGWISGIYFAGYSMAVPLLTSLTDRVDARKVYLASCLTGLIANIGFAAFAHGFWSAMFFRSLCGIGLAGTFIPGLKALIDRIDARFLPRAVSFYTACFGFGMSLSFYYAGILSKGSGWKAVFLLAAACSALVLLLCFMVLKPRRADLSPGPASGILDILNFKPAWKNKGVRTYVTAYMCHMWEMFAARSWMVAFLTFSMIGGESPDTAVMPTTVMAVAGVLGMAASIFFGELAAKYGRKKIVSLVMGTSAVIGLGIGFLVRIPYPLLAGLCIVYTFFFQGDSAAIHAGVITASNPARRGAAMALQSLAGFAAASLSPIAVGFVLDISGGGQGALSWGLTFAAMASSAIIGLILLNRT